MIRKQHVLVIFVFAFILFVFQLAPSSESLHAFSFADDPCPNPLVVQTLSPIRHPTCRFLTAHPSHGGELDVELCLSPDVPNHGWFRIERTDKRSCAKSESIRTSDDPAIDAMLRAKGPDFFHIQFDGEQRHVSEVDVEYLGECNYRYPFRLATAAPVNVSIWWPFHDYRAALETEELALQYDVARPVLDGVHFMMYPAPGAGAHCPLIGALPTDPAWRTPAVTTFLDALPECSRFEPTRGIYLKAHHSELPDALWQQYVFQPVGCRWSNQFLFGAPPNITTRGFQPRNVLLIGDSHVRYAYDMLIDAYTGNWKDFRSAPAMKKLEKTETIGPATFDFVWEAVLMELRIKINCTSIAKYDTIALGGGQHNAVHIPTEKDHAKQWNMADWSALTASLARRLAPGACPGQKSPKVIWLGNPARITRVEPAAQSNWVDARSSWRVRLYDEIAWSHFEKIGAARVDMFAISQPFVNDFSDKLHMRHTDSLAALIQEVHQKIVPTDPPYVHLATTAQAGKIR